MFVSTYENTEIDIKKLTQNQFFLILKTTILKPSNVIIHL